MPRLFDPLPLRGLTLRNRIGVSPMCQYSSVDGFASDWHLVHLGQFATGGAALVMTEAAAISAEGRISPGDLGLWKEEHATQLARIAAFLTSQGAVPGIQLAHAGRKAATRVPWAGGGAFPNGEHPWCPVAPSALPFDTGYAVPRALDERGIADVIADFAMATERAVRAGFRVVEIHAAHGYLVHQFLSPLANQRTDDWGGSFENRTRLAREITKAVRAALPDTLPLFVRISATDWIEGGWDLADSVRLSAELAALGADVIDCSSGGTAPHARIPVAPGYQVPFAERIRHEARVATAAVGMILEPSQADAIIVEEKADLVLLAREMLRDPHFPQRAARALDQPLEWPVQYVRAKR